MTSLRSEAHIDVDGVKLPLKLTLGALSEIEEALGIDTLTDLAFRLGNPSAAELIRILGILAKAAGDEDSDRRVRNGTINLREALGAIAMLFREILTGEAPGKPILGPTAGAAG
ncbi:GTA-gp10 family protein [Parvularcula sp. LCG005]|uniref:GTA-gp10 family protein n=1 Tax=Parvularcula sp. LCG005 TaxID=3078805 RepID=UPI002942EE12|nr:GTA-gp10 family protein [Parvularcula sp. LCG005]WOI53997.1 GTA-gp10 family protein [Parvularcula sp. LCG005]